MRGMIGPRGVDTIRQSLLYKALTLEYGDIEVWRVEARRHDGWWYYSLMAKARGYPHEVALVRYKVETDQVQEPIQMPFGKEDMWVDVPHPSHP